MGTEKNLAQISLKFNLVFFHNVSELLETNCPLLKQVEFGAVTREGPGRDCQCSVAGQARRGSSHCTGESCEGRPSLHPRLL